LRESAALLRNPAVVVAILGIWISIYEMRMLSTLLWKKLLKQGTNRHSHGWSSKPPPVLPQRRVVVTGQDFSTFTNFSPQFFLGFLLQGIKFVG